MAFCINFFTVCCIFITFYYPSMSRLKKKCKVRKLHFAIVILSCEIRAYSSRRIHDGLQVPGRYRTLHCVTVSQIETRSVQDAREFVGLTKSKRRKPASPADREK